MFWHITCFQSDCGRFGMTLSKWRKMDLFGCCSRLLLLTLKCAMSVPQSGANSHHNFSPFALSVICMSLHVCKVLWLMPVSRQQMFLCSAFCWTKYHLATAQTTLLLWFKCTKYGTESTLVLTIWCFSFRRLLKRCSHMHIDRKNKQKPDCTLVFSPLCICYSVGCLSANGWW